MLISVPPRSFTDRYSRNRARTRALFDLVSEEAYYCRPIDLRHPIVFYEGHLPAFRFKPPVKRARAKAPPSPAHSVFETFRCAR